MTSNFFTLSQNVCGFPFFFSFLKIWCDSLLKSTVVFAPCLFESLSDIAAFVRSGQFVLQCF